MSAFSSDTVVLRIRPSLPDDKEIAAKRGPLMMETVLAALHSLRGNDAVMSLEIGVHEGKIGFFARVKRSVAPVVESQLYGQFPDSDIEILSADPFAVKSSEVALSSDLQFTDPEVMPIKRFSQFDDMINKQNVDPIAGITSTLLRYPVPGMRGHVQIVFKPAPKSLRKRSLKFIPVVTKGISKHSNKYANLFTRMQLARSWKRIVFFPVAFFMGGFRTWLIAKPVTPQDAKGDSSAGEMASGKSTRKHDEQDSAAAAVDKVNRLLFLGNVRVSVITPRAKATLAEDKLHEIASSFRQFTLPQCNGFTMGKIHVGQAVPLGMQIEPYILSVEEVATLWHIPNIGVKTPNIDWVSYKKLEPPVNLPMAETDPDVTVLGEAVFRGVRQQFGIKPDDRRRHMYIIGKTGMGKSTLLQNMVHSDIHSGKGIALIDPHGDLVESVLRYIPKNRMNDVILIDPSDKQHPVSFNMLDCKDRDQYPLVASGMMSVFKKLWPDAFSGRMEHILRNTLLALLESQGNSMLGIMRMFTDDAFRAKVLEKTGDHMVKSFWNGEYAVWSDKYRTEAIAAIQNKVGQLVGNPMLRNIIGQVHSTLDIRHAMDSGKVILANLSKGSIGEDESAFLGSMLVTKFQLDAMSRADTPEKDRRDFYLYVDEFQNFATESFATILSEARKYRLNLTMANQYVAQLLIDNTKTTLKDAIFGNVGSLVSFQIGSDDAEELSLQYEEMVQPKDILSLPKYHAYMRLMIDGIPSKPFSVSTLPPPKPEADEARVDVIRNLSRERYTEKRSVVEDKIGKWVASAEEGRKSAKSAEKSKEKEEEEKQKARKKGMKLEEYRAWRDREMWTNDFNMIRKKEFAGEELTEEEKRSKVDLQAKLEKSGGVPPPSKAMIELKERMDAKKAA